jgi:ABC-type amino acid transport substrate-binding protein
MASVKFRILFLAAVAVCMATNGCKEQTYRRVGQVSAYERIMNSKELRVGYMTEVPFLEKSTATGEMTGIFADVGQELADRLGVKLVWVEEVGLASMPEALRQQRVDLIMFPLWRSAARAENVGFSTPIFYSTVGVYVKAGDSRFDRDRKLLNSNKVKVAAIDGELAGEIAQADFPLAKVHSLPQLTDYSQLMMEVATGKADVTFFSQVSAGRFMKQNPGRIKDLTGGTPVRVYAECLVLPIDDFPLRSMIDASLAEMIENGAIDRAFLKNGENPNEYYRPLFPYRVPVAGK